MARSTRPALATAPTTVFRWASALRLAFVVLATASPAARAQATCLPEGGKARVVVIEGESLGLIVNFKNPVDHGRSLLAIVHGGQVIRELQPRFEAQPNTLFAETAMLTPGRYWLQWQVRPASSGDIERGGMRFTIEPADLRPGKFVVAECG